MKLYQLIVGFIVVVFVAIIGMTIFSYSTAGKRKANAQALAIAWANEMYPDKTARAICQGTDNDGDDYVSCTVNVGDKMTVSLDCYSYVFLSFGNTCRTQRAQINRPQE